jgi:hypothetical protein
VVWFLHPRGGGGGGGGGRGWAGRHGKDEKLSARLWFKSSRSLLVNQLDNDRTAIMCNTLPRFLFCHTTDVQPNSQLVNLFKNELKTEISWHSSECSIEISYCHKAQAATTEIHMEILFQFRSCDFEFGNRNCAINVS